MSESENPVTARFEPAADIEGDWLVSGLLIRQRFNEPGKATIELHSQDLMAEPSLMLGTSATVMLERAGVVREFSGIVERVEDGVSTEHELVTTLTVVPALVALRYRTNSRIFQEMTIPEILEKVLTEGLDPFERKIDLGYLSGTYAAQEYTVQYQETDFDFVHRLMEEHGINYHFVNQDGAEVMTLHDSGRRAGGPGLERELERHVTSRLAGRQRGLDRGAQRVSPLFQAALDRRSHQGVQLARAERAV